MGVGTVRRERAGVEEEEEDDDDDEEDEDEREEETKSSSSEISKGFALEEDNGSSMPGIC